MLVLTSMLKPAIFKIWYEQTPQRKFVKNPDFTSPADTLRHLVLELIQEYAFLE